MILRNRADRHHVNGASNVNHVNDASILNSQYDDVCIAGIDGNNYGDCGIIRKSTSMKFHPALRNDYLITSGKKLNLFFFYQSYRYVFNLFSDDSMTYENKKSVEDKDFQNSFCVLVSQQKVGMIIVAKRKELWWPCKLCII